MHASDVERKAELHRAVLAVWQEEMARRGMHFGVRAGYGWDATTARCYESRRLNQEDAPVYMRLSIGIEPSSYTETLAVALNTAVQRVLS